MNPIKPKMHKPSTSSTVWNAVKYVMVVAALLCNASAIVFGYISSSNVAGLFNNTQGNISAKYYNEVVPLPIIFAIIWPIIYLWTFAGSFYMIVALCLPTDESPVKITPSLAPNTYFLFVCFGFLSSVMWLFAFDQERLAYSFTLLAVAAFSFYLALFMSIALVEGNAGMLAKPSQSMLWVMRVLIHNGLAMICTWLTLAASIGLVIVILYEDSPGQNPAVLRGLFSIPDASSMVLGGVGGLMLVWFLLQNFVWQKYLAYVYTDYPVLIIAFSGIVAKLSPNPVDRSLVIASINLALAVLLLLARITLSVFYFINRDYVKMSKCSTDKKHLIEKEK